jgi:hypothetical protein
VPGPERAGRFDIADIVVSHREELESVHTLSREQKRVLTDIAQCRTAALGGHIERCTQCDYEHPAYNSCRNRHCPKCQALAQEKWIAEQRTRMLDVAHFHVVFTMPAELRPLARFAPRVLYDALFHAAGHTLLEFGESRLGATIGATLVLHTWTRKLEFHPHVHAIVTAGGLRLDRTGWVKAQRKFLFPVKAMSRVLRGKMLDELKNAYRKRVFDDFEAFDDPEGFDRLLRRIGLKSWYVYAKPSFSEGEYVLQYLGRYTHRVGMANSRLLDMQRDSVTFRTKGGGTATLAPVEFLRRLVAHVLPPGFHKIRHIGLAPRIAKVLSFRDRLRELTGRDITVCPRCLNPLIALAISAAHARAPPRQAA